MKRRHFLVGAVVFSALRPFQLLASWSEKSFRRSTLQQAFLDALGTKDLLLSDKITIVAPPAAGDSSLVPVAVISSLKGEELFLFVEKNITPLVFRCILYSNTLAFFSLNIKMKESSALYAVVREGEKYFMATVAVAVEAEGC